MYSVTLSLSLSLSLSLQGLKIDDKLPIVFYFKVPSGVDQGSGNIHKGEKEVVGGLEGMSCTPDIVPTLNDLQEGGF